MENQDLEVFDAEDFNQEAPKKRPAFITVLAILSWVFIGYGTLIRVLGITVTEEQHEEQMVVVYEEVEKLGDSTLGVDMVNYKITEHENRKFSNLSQLIFLFLEGFAVFMMFKLKRNGYWLYTIAQIGFIAMVFYVLPGENVISKMAITYYLFIIILFQILYGVNLKHMKE